MSDTPPPSSAPEGSLKRTVLQTVVTVALTVLLIALVREALSALPWVDHATGGHTGATVLRFLAADGVAQKQQGVALVLMVLCFLVAVGVVKGGERLWRRS